MNLVENSGQKVGNDSNAIQVSGNLNIGNSTTEILTICELVIAKQMASLRQDALEIANARAKEFGNQIIEKLSTELDEKIIEKLKDPDLQYVMSQSIVQVARKGLGSKSDLMKELIVSKIKNDEEDSDILLDHAFEITHKLSSSELKLLAVICYFRNVTKIDINSKINIIEILEHPDENYSYYGINKEFCRKYFLNLYQNLSIDFDRITDGSETIKKVNFSMLQIKGCLETGKSYNITYFALIEKRTGLVLDNNEDITKKYFPELILLLKKFGIKDLDEFNKLVLSPLGYIIAFNYLKARGFL